MFGTYFQSDQDRQQILRERARRLIADARRGVTTSTDLSPPAERTSPGGTSTFYVKHPKWCCDLLQPRIPSFLFLAGMEVQTPGSSGSPQRQLSIQSNHSSPSKVSVVY